MRRAQMNNIRKAQAAVGRRKGARSRNRRSNENVAHLRHISRHSAPMRWWVLPRKPPGSCAKHSMG
jgi:hypothetical protein